MSQLTAGSCMHLSSAMPGDEILSTPHNLQFLSIKKVTPQNANPSAPDRYRIIMSDGIHFVQAMLATQLNSLVQDGMITKNTIAVIEKMTCNFVQEKRLLIVLALRVLQKEAEKIGTPDAIKADSTGEQQQQPKEVPRATSASAQAVNAGNAKPQPPQNARQSGPAKNGKHAAIFPIESLSPYQNNWTIKARVTQKSDVRVWSNQRGEGKLFSVTLMDETGEIKGTAFNAAVDELYDKFQDGKVYYISKARVNLAKKKFSNLANDYELSFERNTDVEECFEANSVPMVKYNFVSLSQLEEIAKDSTCDVIGIVREVGSLTEINTKMNRTVTKRDLTLVDKSNYSVKITLWGKQAEQFTADDSPVIAFKGVKVSDFGGRSLSMFASSTMSINPDIDESFALRGWYDALSGKETFESHSGSSSSGLSGGLGFNRAELRNLHDVKESQLGMSDKPEYFSARAMVMHIKSDNIWYPACPSQGCNKKVVEMNGEWRCEKCDRSYEKPEYRYVISMAVADWSGQAWLQGFNDVGEALFGRPANDLQEIRERNEEEYNALMAKATSSIFNFSCRAKQDTYNDQTRVRYGISKILPLDYKEEANALCELLRSPWAQ